PTQRSHAAVPPSAPRTTPAPAPATTAVGATDMRQVLAAPAESPLAVAEVDAAVAATANPVSDCETDVDALPAARGATARDNRRLHRGSALVAHKSARRLMLYQDGVLQGCWRIALGFAPEGHKEVEGDGKTPNGWYRTSDKPWSIFDDAIAIHYPATRDAADARADGRIRRSQHKAITEANARGSVPPQRTPMGGAILIHGGGSARDWTLGCIALEDRDLAQLRSQLPRRMKTHLMIVE
ncbi:MAG: L,D-transpeptidase family protein, partial [Myxococcota bacterium]